ncbi:MAG: hypothetical protein IJW67_01115 [Blautia sp.]|nr:hypothetical protein [Blautia sp.]
MMKKGMIAVLSAAMVMSLTTCPSVFASEEPAAAESTGKQQITEVEPYVKLKYELTSVGEFSTEENLRFGYGDVAYVSEGDSYAVVSAFGEKIQSGITSSKNIGDGHYVVNTPLNEENVNTTGLISMDGTVLIPCEAASIALPGNREKDGIRFVAVIYATDKTENEDECIIYFTNSMFSFSISEDDVMYKGYARIYDIQEERFVEGIQLDSFGRDSLQDLSDSFVIKGIGGSSKMYDPEGNVIWETTGYLNDITAHALSVSSGGTYYIVDSAGKDRYRSEANIGDLNDQLDYFTIYDGDGENAKYHAIDIDGNRVLDLAQPILYSACGKYFNTSSDDNGYNVVDEKGNVVIENAKSSINVLGSYGYVKMEDGSFYLINPDGLYSELEEANVSDLFFGKGDKAVVLNTGEASLSFSDTADLRTKGVGLLVAEEQSSSGDYYGAYDLFTGEQILPTEYTEINTAGDYIFANRTGSGTNSVWEVYKAELVPAE